MVPALGLFIAGVCMAILPLIPAKYWPNKDEENEK